MIAPEVLDAMLEAGCTAEQIVTAVKAAVRVDQEREEARKAAQRAGNAERQQRFRDQRKGRKTKGNNQRNDSNALRDVTPPNEYISNPPVSPSPDGEAPHDFADRFVSVWNEGAKAGLQEARKLTGQRLTKLKARKRCYTEAELLEAARNLARSPFHCGKNDREWAANIGWLIKSDENVAKALELKPATAANDHGSGMVASILAKRGRGP